MAVGDATGAAKPAGHIQYSCFISYKRPFDAPPDVAPELQLESGAHIFEQIARGVQRRLGERIDPSRPPFLDLALPYGADVRARLSRSLCRSACLVAILTPEYFESPWCLGEWEAMKRLEKRRIPGRNVQDLGLIIPVLFQGNKREMVDRCEGRLWADLLGIQNVDRQLKNVRKLEVIAKIAETIKQVMKLAVGGECGEFLIDLAPVKPAIPDPNPMGD